MLTLHVNICPLPPEPMFAQVKFSLFDSPVLLNLALALLKFTFPEPSVSFTEKFSRTDRYPDSSGFWDETAWTKGIVGAVFVVT